MERRCRVELFEQIRREYEHGSGTIIGTANKFGVHRRTVRQAIECALPPERKKPDRKRVKFDAVKGFIEQILRDDERAPRKQRMECSKNPPQACACVNSARMTS